MKVNFDYNFKDTKESPQEITLSLITSAVSQKYEKGLEGQKRRIFGRIQRKLEEAIESKAEEIELEEAEKDFLRSAYKDAKYPAVWSKNIIEFEDEMEKL